MCLPGTEMPAVFFDFALSLVPNKKIL